MARWLIRGLGWGLLGLALAIAGWDTLGWLEDGRLAPLAVGALWFKLSPFGINLTQAVIQRYVWPPLWDPGIVAILVLPAAPMAAALGAIAVWATRRRD